MVVGVGRRRGRAHPTSRVGTAARLGYTCCVLLVSRELPAVLPLVQQNNIYTLTLRLGQVERYYSYR